MRYEVVNPPALLLFADKGAIDGEEYTLKQEPKPIADHLIALASQPNVISGKKERHQREQEALESTVELKRDGIDQFFDSFWKENNCESEHEALPC